MPIDALATTQHEPGPGGAHAASGPRASEPRLALTRIADRYAVTSSLGSGSMGEVFAALDERSGERVAVEVLHRRDASAHGVERLLREASAAGRVQHPAVVRVFEAGVDEANDLAYIARELLMGKTLRALLACRGHLAPDEAVALLSPSWGAGASGASSRSLRSTSPSTRGGTSGAAVPRNGEQASA